MEYIASPHLSTWSQTWILLVWILLFWISETKDFSEIEVNSGELKIFSGLVPNLQEKQEVCESALKYFCNKGLFILD